MKISPISVLNTYKSNQQNKIQYKNNLPYDTVSFSAKRKKTDNQSTNPHISTSVKVGEELFTKLETGGNKRDIIRTIQEKIPTLKVAPLKEMEDQVAYADCYAAYFSSEIADDFSMNHSIMYLNEKPFKVGDKNEKLSFALDVAHEYTHAQQVISGKDAEFYKKISNGDVKLARAITAISNITYELMDKEMQNRTLPNIFANPIDMINFQRYGKEIPRETYVTKNTLISNAKCSNELQYKKIVENEFQQAFVRTIEYIVEHPENVEPSILDTLMKIGKEDKIDELRDMTKQMCSHMAEEEYEARTTECIMAKNILGTKKTLNIDCYPIYYDMLSKALK